MVHTPYHTRHGETLYIGPAHPKPTNGLGIAGFVISLLTLFLTAGILSPIGLFISLLAMFKRPRGLAFAGVLIGLLPTLFWGAIAFGVVSSVKNHHEVAQVNRETAMTNAQINETLAKIELFRSDNDRLPGDISGNRIAIEQVDAWKEPLRYEVHEDHFLVRSAGPDGDFETGDDIVRKVQVGQGEIRKIYPSSADSSSDSEFDEL